MDALNRLINQARGEVAALQGNHEFQAKLAEDAARLGRQTDVVAQRSWRMLVGRIAPVRAASIVWGDPNDTPATVAVRKWLREGAEEHLVLRGGIGCGKSTAACLAVKHWCEPTAKTFAASDEDPAPLACWFTPDDLVSAVLHAYDERAPKLRRYVVVDDMGRERVPADFAEAMCRVLDLADHTLLITTNLTREETRARYDLRMIDRLCDTATAVDLPAQSLRRSNPKF